MFDCKLCGKRHRHDSAIGKEHEALMKKKMGQIVEQMMDITSEFAAPIPLQYVESAMPWLFQKETDPVKRKIVKGFYNSRFGTIDVSEEDKAPEQIKMDFEWHPNFIMNRMEKGVGGDTDGMYAWQTREFSLQETWLYAPQVARAHKKKWHSWNERKRKKMLRYYGIDEHGNRVLK